MKLKWSLLNEKSQTQKAPGYMIPFIGHLEKTILPGNKQIRGGWVWGVGWEV